MRTATFRPINGASYKISDIQVAGSDGVGNDTAQKMNADGTWGEDMFYYLTMDGASVPNGWYKDSFGDTPVTDSDVIATGEALMVYADTDVTFTYSGQVSAGSVPVDLAAGGWMMLGNPNPTACKLSQILVSGSEGVGNDTAQKMELDGQWGIDMYYYLTADGASVPDGWYKDSFGDVPVTDADALAPGEAVMFYSDSDLTVTFPSVL